MVRIDLINRKYKQAGRVLIGTVSLFVSALALANNSTYKYTKNNEVEDVYPLARYANPMVTGGAGPGGFMVDTAAFIVPNGRVIIYGYKKSGIAGNGGKDSDWRNKDPSPPVYVSKLKHVTSIVGGIYHLLALDVNGDVWGWGQSQFKQTGCIGDKGDDVRIPCKVLSNGIAIAAGENVSIALTKDGNVYAWGHNTHGQLGNGEVGEDSLTPIHVNGITHTVTERENKSKITKKIKGMNHEKAIIIGGAYQGGFAVTNSNGKYNVWGWGDDQAKILGYQKGCSSKNTPIPVIIKALDKYASQIVYIGGGNRFAAALLNNGDVIAWGHKDLLAGKLVKSNNKTAEDQDDADGSNCTATPIVMLKNVKQLVARYRGVIALTNDHKIYTWGAKNADNGFNTYGDTITERKVNGVPIYVSAGKEHVYYVTSEGETYGIGYNAQGQSDPANKPKRPSFPGALIPVDKWVVEAAE